MEDYGHLTRAELISLIRELKAAQDGAGGPAGEKPAEFQVFSEWHQREFDRSPWPMRIFEHGTFRFLAVNDAAVKLYGYSREEFLKLTARDTRHLDEHAEFLTTLNEPTEYLRHRGARRHIRKNGEIIVVEAVTQDILFNGLKARLSMNIDVTERDRARALLQQREQEFESLAEHLPDLIARFDRNIRHLYVNAATERATGLPRQAFLGRTHHEISLPPDKAGLFDRSIREVFETGRASEIEFSLSTPEGERYFIARHLPEHDADGEVRTALCVAHDVTELRQAVQLLGRREMEFESLAEHLPDLVARFDRASRYVYLNRAVEKLTGKERDDIIGRTQRELGLPEDIVAKFDDSLAGVFNTGDSHAVEFRFPAPGGDRLFEALHVPEKDPDGKVHTVLCVARDITERKRAEQVLREAQQRLQVAVRGGGVGLWDWDVGAGTIYFSPEWKQQLGFEEHEIPNRFEEWDNRLHPDDRARVSTMVKEFLERPHSDYRVEYRLRHKNGSYRWILSKASAQLGKNGTIERMFGCHIDISEQKQAEVERLESIVRQRDALVREVHHRIKNSLQGVVGLLRSKIWSNPAAAKDIRAAIAQIQSVALVYGLQCRPSGGAITLVEILEAICSSVGNIAGGFIDRQFRRDSGNATYLAETEAVPIAVVLNELMFNGLKHGLTATGERRIRVELSGNATASVVTILNGGTLPAGFDYSGGSHLGVGLGLVKTLLSPTGGKLTYHLGHGVVEARLELREPLIVMRQLDAVA